MRRRSVDPFYITARYDSLCSCGQPIRKGQRVMYFPAKRKVECEKCSGNTAALLADERAHEAMWGNL